MKNSCRLGVLAFVLVYSCASLSGCASCGKTGGITRNPELDSAAPFRGALLTAPDVGVPAIEGFLSNGRFRSAATAYLTSTARGTVFVVHGFGSTTHSFDTVIRRFSELGFDVVGIDLPGHGKSDGSSEEIPDFSVYREAVAGLFAACDGILPRPYIGFGHSLGALAIYDSQSRDSKTNLDRMILVTPLTRSIFWHWSYIGYRLARPFIAYTTNSYGKRFPLSWFGALVEWNREAEGFPRIGIPSIVILGGADRVIDGKNAERLFGEKLTDVDFVHFSWMDHVEIMSSALDSRLWKVIAEFVGQFPATP